MDGAAIRQMRIRLGLTQNELAIALGVDQGTVSRWERGVERPRAKRMAALRDILIKDEEDRALARALAIARHDLYSAPVTLLDARLRVSEMSQTGIEFMRKRGYDPQTLIGKDIYSWSERLDVAGFPELLQWSGVLTGDALLLRFVRNDRGHGHVTVYEPIFESGELVGVLNFVTKVFRFDKNAASTLELVEVVPADDPGRLHVLHEGQRMQQAIAAVHASTASGD